MEYNTSVQKEHNSGCSIVVRSSWWSYQNIIMALVIVGGLWLIIGMDAYLDIRAFVFSLMLIIVPTCWIWKTMTSIIIFNDNGIIENKKTLIPWSKFYKVDYRGPGGWFNLWYHTDDGKDDFISIRYHYTINRNKAMVFASKKLSNTIFTQGAQKMMNVKWPW